MDVLERRILGERITVLQLLLGLAVFWFAVVVYQTAWISDDAFITLRVVDNTVSGYGPVYNVGERVQAYTHTLWKWLLTAFYAVTREAYITTMLVSMVISLITVWVVAFRIARTQLAALGAVVLMTVSKAFTDYATSGLENPLSHLILALFLMVFLLGDDEFTPRRIALMSTLAGLAMLNRTDAILLYAPAMFYALWQRRQWDGIPAAAVGAVPVLAWHLFSLFYYGLPFSNTAYAKLNTGIPRIELAVSALRYVEYSLRMDRVTLPLIATGLVVAFGVKRPRFRMIGVGVALYLLYIINIGGDFMVGRFFSLPFLAMVAVLVRAPLKPVQVQRQTIFVGLLMVLGVASVFSPVLSGANYSFKILERAPFAMSYDVGPSIVDERAFFHSCSGFAAWVEARGDVPLCERGTVGLELRAEAPTVSEPLVQLGYPGYFAGPRVYMVGAFALVDPLLSHLPAADDWRIGHFRREPPPGHRESLVSGENRIEDPELAAYYDVIRLITRGDLLAEGRLEAIWKLNTGQYDHLIDHYQ